MDQERQTHGALCALARMDDALAGGTGIGGDRADVPAISCCGPSGAPSNTSSARDWTVAKTMRSLLPRCTPIRELARKEAFEVVEILAEMQSAKAKGRPVFNEMLSRIEAGEADGIIAWHPDRLARNALDGGRIIDMLDEGLIQDMRFCSFWFENTSQGKFMLMWAFGQGKYHVDMFS